MGHDVKIKTLYIPKRIYKLLVDLMCNKITLHLKDYVYSKFLKNPLMRMKNHPLRVIDLVL